MRGQLTALTSAHWTAGSGVQWIYRLIHLQKTNSIPALKRLINEAASEISENTIRQAVSNFNSRFHLCIRNNGAHFEM